MSEPDELAEVRRTGAKAAEWNERHEAAMAAAYKAEAATMKTLAEISTSCWPAGRYSSAETIRKVLRRWGVLSRPAGWAGRVDPVTDG